MYVYLYTWERLKCLRTCIYIYILILKMVKAKHRCMVTLWVDIIEYLYT
jgi:hypothetical protein